MHVTTHLLSHTNIVQLGSQVSTSSLLQSPTPSHHQKKKVQPKLEQSIQRRTLKPRKYERKKHNPSKILPPVSNSNSVSRFPFYGPPVPVTLSPSAWNPKHTLAFFGVPSVPFVPFVPKYFYAFRVVLRSVSSCLYELRHRAPFCFVRQGFLVGVVCRSQFSRVLGSQILSPCQLFFEAET